MECKPYGDRGVLLSALSDAERSGIVDELDQALPTGCLEYVLGYDSILLIGKDLSTEYAHALLQRKRSDAMPIVSTSNRCHAIRVHYDGEDIDAVAEACGLSVAEVVKIHSAPTYTVRMMGFSPGFPYLDGLDPRLHLERRQSPRNHIAPGTIAIGGSHAGIYSVASPGGWHLLGQTDLTLFDVDAAQRADPTQAFALVAGDQVRFQPVPIK